MKRSAKSNRRNEQGAAIAEFGGAFVMLVVFFFIPLVNMSFIGVRGLIAQGITQEFVHRLALADKRSDSYATLGSDSSWSNTCNALGVQASAATLSLIVVDKNGSQTSYHSGQSVPSSLLPGGTNAPCIYTYQLSTNAVVPPIYSGGGPAIPALTKPITFTLLARSAWENLSPDPATKGFFINE